MALPNTSKKQENSETIRRITTNFAYFLSGELVAKFLGYLAIILIARKLRAEEFGSLGFAEAFFSYFIYIGIAGVDTIATRNIARNKDLGNDYIGDVVSLKLLLWLLAYVLLAVLALSVGIAPKLKYLTLLYGLCLLPIALSTEWLFQGLEKMKYIGLFRVLREVYFACSYKLFELSR
jgi:PST family polysaccharide transporter